jgi:hypothetical protein
MRFRSRQHGASQARRFRSPPAKAGGDHDRSLRTARAEFADERGNGSRSVYLGLTGKMGPVNPPLIRLRSTIAPTLRSRPEAPMIATDCGRNRCSRLRTLMGGFQSAP